MGMGFHSFPPFSPDGSFPPEQGHDEVCDVGSHGGTMSHNDLIARCGCQSLLDEACPLASYSGGRLS